MSAHGGDTFSGAEVNELAAGGDAESFIQGLRQRAHSGDSVEVTVPIGRLLDNVKDGLRAPLGYPGPSGPDSENMQSRARRHL